MNHKPLNSIRLLRALVLLGLLLAIGCDNVGIVGESCYGTFHRCETEVWQCLPVNKKLDLKPSGTSQIPTANNYTVGKDLWNDKSMVYYPYYNNNALIVRISKPELKGALWVQTGRNDWNSTAAVFMRVVVSIDDPDQMYIAYDSRYTNVPGWLNKDYVREEVSPGVPHKITIAMAGGPVDMEIWRRRTPPKKGVPVELPGNNYENPGWAKVTVGNPTMYFIIVKPKTEVNCSVQGTKLFTWFFPSPEFNMPIEEVKLAAEKDCLSKFPNLQCQATKCETKGEICDSNISTISQGLKPYPSGSQIEFSAPSKATITIRGQNYTSNISGDLHFQYLNSSHDLELNSLILNLSPFNTQIGKFSDNTVLLMNNATAKCQDAIPTFGKPCDAYQIANNELLATENLLLDGKLMHFNLINSQPVDIQIDHTLRTFNISSTLQMTLKVNNRDTTADITLDLLGKFVAFSPIAVGSESTRFSECVENRNQDPFYLNAAGSFDIYDALPSNPATFQWYEDYGLVTQKDWGTGTSVIIPAQQLGFGFHDITLVVQDKDGTIATDNFEIEVGDTTPPTLSIPPDVNTPISFFTPDTVQIGEASASDACCDETLISNDAPTDLHFAPGFTTVTWQADDGRGNLVNAQQSVNVNTIKLPGGVLLPAGILVGIVIASYWFFKIRKK